MKHTTLPTQLEIATYRAERIARAAAKVEKAAAWAARLSPAAYICTREGSSWIACGPADQRFEFSRTDTGDVLCISASGGIYILTAGAREAGGDGVKVCDCKARQKAAICKHEAAWAAVVMAHKMTREAVQAALRAEAAAMGAEDQEPLHNVVCVTSDGERTVVLERLPMARIEQVYPFALAGPAHCVGTRMTGGQYFTVEPCDLDDAADPAAEYRDFYPGEDYDIDHLRAEAEERDRAMLARLRTEGEDAERACAAEWMAANQAGRE